jgi:hypothetical protein
MFVVSYLNPLWSLEDYANDHLYIFSINDLKSARELCEDICFTSLEVKQVITSPLPPKKEPLETDCPLEPLNVRRMTF